MRVRRDLGYACVEELGDYLAQRSPRFTRRQERAELEGARLLSLPGLCVALEPERLLGDDLATALDARLPPHRAIFESALLDHLLLLGCARASIAATG